MDSPALRRREYLSAVVATAGLAGCSDPADPDGSSDADVPGSENGAVGVGQTVTVGPGGTLVFEPRTVEVDPGEVVVWEWDSDTHNVVVDSQPDGADWEGQPADETFDTGYVYEHTFEVEGTYEYFCQPHSSAGMVGEVLVGDASSAFDNTIEVGPLGDLVFEPAEVSIEAGETLTWEWDSDNHNVVVDSRPDGAGWEGQPADETYDAGHVYEHTLEVPGTYEYYCHPHRPAGMTGTIFVEE